MGTAGMGEGVRRSGVLRRGRGSSRARGKSRERSAREVRERAQRGKCGSGAQRGKPRCGLGMNCSRSVALRSGLRQSGGVLRTRRGIWKGKGGRESGGARGAVRDSGGGLRTRRRIWKGKCGRKAVGSGERCGAVASCGRDGEFGKARAGEKRWRPADATENLEMKGRGEGVAAQGR